MRIPLSKYHGCGNDFILLKASQVQDWSAEQIQDFVRSICDRHTGIGADGCIFAGINPLEMIFFNQDGSRAEMCGNGIRCLAAFLLDEGLVDQTRFEIQTLAGTRMVQVVEKEGTRLFEIEMGQPDLSAKAVALNRDEPVWNETIHVNDQDVDLFSLFMNVIHTVTFVDTDPRTMDLSRIGPVIETLPLYTQKTNVNFVHILQPDSMECATWERGAGATLACGTGCCASVWTAWKEGLCADQVRVFLKRGFLDITIHDNGIRMAGPAVRILKGDYFYE